MTHTNTHTLTEGNLLPLELILSGNTNAEDNQTHQKQSKYLSVHVYLNSAYLSIVSLALLVRVSDHQWDRQPKM